MDVSISLSFVLCLIKYRAGLAKNRLAGRILYAGTFGLVLLQGVMTYSHTTASIANYPGGEALKLFNDKYAGSKGNGSFFLSWCGL